MTRPPQFEPGDHVTHYGQKFARTHPGGTAIVVEVKGPYNDGAYEYVVDTTEQFASLPSDTNPMTHRTQWASYMTIPAYGPTGIED